MSAACRPSRTFCACSSSDACKIAVWGTRAAQVRDGDDRPSGRPSSPHRLARYRLFQVSAQILEDLLLALLDFEQDRRRHANVVLLRMDLARLHENCPQIADAIAARAAFCRRFES